MQVFRSVRARLLVWNIAGLAVVLTLLSSIIHYAVQRNLMSSVDNLLLAHARVFSHPPPNRPFGGRWRPGSRFAPGNAVNGSAPPFSHQPWSPQGGPPPGSPPPGAGGNPGGPPPGGGAGFNGPPPVGGGLPPDGTPPRPPERGRPPQPPTRTPSGVILQIYDHDGKPLLHREYEVSLDKSLFAAALHGQKTFATVDQNGEEMRVLVGPMHLPGRQEGVYQFSYPLASTLRAIADMNATLFTLLPFALLISGIGGSILTNKALKPVRLLSKSLGNIQASDLSKRLPVSGDDEFAELTHACNLMLNRLDSDFRRREALMREMAAVMERQKRFTADASHELKTPLTIIKANTSLLLQEGNLAPPLDEAIADIDSAANVMRTLVQDLLLLARYDTSGKEHNMVSVPLLPMLEDAKKRVTGHAERNVKINISSPDLQVVCNPDSLTRVWVNLLDNAFRYTPVDGTVWIDVSKMNDVICVTVSDTGVGIAKEHLSHMGERFYRVDDARTRAVGGTGLGLSICRSIVSAHGGTFEIESEPGKGTQVHVCLTSRV